MAKIYERYVDKDGRLFIVLNRWMNPKRAGKYYEYIPTTVDLLDVAKESSNELQAADFERWVNKGKLMRLKPKTDG